MKSSEKILALDVGEKFIGCAISGEDGIAPEPLPAIVRKNHSLSLGVFRRLLTSYPIATVVVGLPLNHRDHVEHGKEHGTSTAQSRKIKGFIFKLKKHFPEVTFVTQDETLSTWSAKRSFARLKLKKTSDRVNIDSFAAMDILNSYLRSSSDKLHAIPSDV